MDPRKIVEDLQVAQIALVKAPYRFASGIFAERSPVIQFPEARPGPNHLLRIGHEKMIEQEHDVILAQVLGRYLRDLEESVGGSLVSVADQLHEEALGPG